MNRRKQEELVDDNLYNDLEQQEFNPEPIDPQHIYSNPTSATNPKIPSMNHQEQGIDGDYLNQGNQRDYLNQDKNNNNQEGDKQFNTSMLQGNPIVENINEEENYRDNYLNEEQILQIVLNDYDNSRIYQTAEIARMHSWRKQYRGDHYGNERKGHTKVVSKDIRKFAEWSITSTLDAFVSTPDIIKCYPLHPSSVNQAKLAEILLNSQFCHQFNRYDFLSKALRVLDVDGTCVIKTGWEYAEEDVVTTEYVNVPSFIEGTDLFAINKDGSPVFRKQPTIVSKTITTINHPTAMVCRNDDIFIDPTALGDIKNCNFIIHRYATNLSALRLENKYKNLDQLETIISGSAIGDADYPRDENFMFSDDPRRRVIVYEYWGNIDINNDGITEPVVVTFANEILLRVQENPFPDKKPPFIVVPFMPKPFTFYGDSNIESIDYIQKLKTAVLRGITDSMVKANSGQIGIRKGAIDERNMKRLLSGENFEFNGSPNDIYTAQFNQIAPSTFNLLDFLNNEAEGLTGLSALGVRGNPQGLKSNNTGATQPLDSGNIRKLQIVRNISENLIKPLLRKWLSYNFELLGNDYMLRVSDYDFIPIQPDNIRGDIDIGLQISTNEDNQIKAQELAFLLQTIGPSGDPYTNKRLMVEIARLHKMYDLADSIEKYEPQPDPYEQAIKELEIKKLQAEIQAIASDVGRVGMDTELKRAKAQTETAKARSLGSRSNLDELKYYNDRNNINFQRDMEKKDQENRHKIELEQTKSAGKIATELLRSNNKDRTDRRRKPKKPVNQYDSSLDSANPIQDIDNNTGNNIE